MNRTRAALATILLVLPGCSSPVHPGETSEAVQGTWRLVGLAGDELPVDEGPLITRTGESSICHRILSDGSFALDDERRRYTLHYHYRNSCTGSILSQTTVSGDFDEAGGTLRLGADHSEREFDAQFDGDTVKIQFFEYLLEFSAPRPPVDRIQGEFVLLGLDPRPRNGCDEPVEWATLSLRPAAGPGPETGTFEWRWSADDACGGTDGEDGNEGVYEQVDRLLDFTAQVGPNSVSRFRGEIEDDRIVLYAGEDWVFGR